MSRSKLFALARSLTLMASVGAPCLAQAADLLPPPPPMPMAPPPVEVGGGWYLRGDVGVGAAQYDQVTTKLSGAGATIPSNYVIDQKTIGDSYFAGAGIGYQVNDFFRFDATAQYRGFGHAGFVESFDLADPATGAPGKGIDQNSFKVRSILAMANFSVDLGTWWCLTPFLTGGVGAAFHQTSAFSDIGAGNARGGFGTAPSRDSVSLAWTAGAGVAYNVTSNLKVEVGYSFTNMGDAKTGVVTCVNSPDCGGASYRIRDITSHDVKLGVRYLLGAAAPAPLPPLAPAYEPGPLVRKY